MRAHGGATRLSSKPHHFLIGAALAALLLGLEESGDATHRHAHATLHPVTLMSQTARHCRPPKADVRAPSKCAKSKAESGVRPRSN
jgi:hypothetical protein